MKGVRTYQSDAGGFLGKKPKKSEWKSRPTLRLVTPGKLNPFFH